MEGPEENSAASHWLEQLHIRLDKIPAEARKTAFALLKSPWECPGDYIANHVPHPLNNQILLMQRSVLLHVFGKRFPLRVITAVAAARLDAYAVQSNNSAIDLGSYADAKQEAYIGAAKEDLAKIGKRWSELSHQARAALISLYAIGEVTLYVMAGMLEKIDTGNRPTRYVMPSQLQPAYKIMWFSRYWAQQSTIADAFFAHDTNKVLQQSPTPYRQTTAFQTFVDVVLDKYLFLHWDYISELSKTKNGIALRDLRTRTELLCFLWLQVISQLSLRKFDNTTPSDQPLAEVSFGRLQKEGFGSTALNALLIESQNHPPGDQFITRQYGTENLLIHNLNLKFAAQKYLQPFIDRIGSPIGDWFEKEYVLKYLSDRLNSSRFLVWRGISDKNYDADILIFDKRSKIFYFCQVKHRAQSLQPFLRDELNEYFRNETICHGIDQLQGLQAQIDSDSVRHRLISHIGKKLVGEGPLKNRSRFLLIHTVENLDMCTRDGIAFYEWNTFRNLIQGIINYKNGDWPGQLRYRTFDLDFSDIESVQTHLINVATEFHKNATPTQPTPSQAYEICFRSELSLNYRTAFWLNGLLILQKNQNCLRTPLL